MEILTPEQQAAVQAQVDAAIKASEARIAEQYAKRGTELRAWINAKPQSAFNVALFGVGPVLWGSAGYWLHALIK